MGIKKSQFKPGETVFAKSPQTKGTTVIITLIKYIPNNEWYAEFDDPITGKRKKDYFDEKYFD